MPSARQVLRCLAALMGYNAVLDLLAKHTERLARLEAVKQRP
jgi:hypothetical protein